MSTATLETLAVGDRVMVEYREDAGTIVAAEGGRYFVTWDADGKTWIYPSAELTVAS